MTVSEDQSPWNPRIENERYSSGVQNNPVDSLQNDLTNAEERERE